MLACESDRIVSQNVPEGRARLILDVIGKGVAVSNLPGVKDAYGIALVRRILEPLVSSERRADQLPTNVVKDLAADISHRAATS
jgi:hypothetical protein